MRMTQIGMAEGTFVEHDTALEVGADEISNQELHRGSEFEAYRGDADAAFEQLQSEFSGRDAEPIIGLAAKQFEIEGAVHTERYKFLVDKLESEIAGRSPRTIVDAGCGPAILTRLIASRCRRARVAGVDRSADMVRHSRTRFDRESILEADARQLSELDLGPIDAIVSRRMIHRVEDLDEMLEKMTVALAPGGVLVNYSFRHPEDPDDQRAFIRAAELRLDHADLHSAYVRAVLNAPTFAQYGHALKRIGARRGVESIRLICYSFDVAFVIRMCK
jgi:ubiquinone/menaquinone biosynthesis C-methylase UbiE